MVFSNYVTYWNGPYILLYVWMWQPNEMSDCPNYNESPVQCHYLGQNCIADKKGHILRKPFFMPSPASISYVFRLLTMQASSCSDVGSRPLLLRVLIFAPKLLWGINCTRKRHIDPQPPLIHSTEGCHNAFLDSFLDIVPFSMELVACHLGYWNNFDRARFDKAGFWIECNVIHDKMVQRNRNDLEWMRAWLIVVLQWFWRSVCL